MNWPAHPDDEWVEITSYSSDGPEYLLGQSYIGKEVARARAAYLDGQTQVEDFEATLDDLLFSQ